MYKKKIFIFKTTNVFFFFSIKLSHDLNNTILLTFRFLKIKIYIYFKKSSAMHKQLIMYCFQNKNTDLVPNFCDTLSSAFLSHYCYFGNDKFHDRKTELKVSLTLEILFFFHLKRYFINFISLNLKFVRRLTEK